MEGALHAVLVAPSAHLPFLDVRGEPGAASARESAAPCWRSSPVADARAARLRMTHDGDVDGRRAQEEAETTTALALPLRGWVL